MHTVTLLTRSTPTLFRQAARALHSSSRTFRPLAFRPTSSSPIASHYLGPNAIAARTFSSNVAVRAPEHASAAVEPPDYLSEGELAVYTKLKKELEPTRLEVQDISGGCGSMYGLDIVSPKFKGMSVIQQHKLVNGLLKEELKSWHGVQLKTKAA